MIKIEYEFIYDSITTYRMLCKVNKNSLILDLEFKLIFFIFVCSSKYEKSLVGTNERVK